MESDVKTLKELNEEAKRRCVLSEGDRSHMDKNSLYKPFSDQVVGFNIRYIYFYDITFILGKTSNV